MLEGRPLQGRALEELKIFLASQDLNYDEGIEYSACVLDDDYKIIAAGSVEENVLKCIAVDPHHLGEGLSGSVVSQLVQYEFEHGRSRLVLYTKPKNEEMFRSLGFYTVFQTKSVLFMENEKQGFKKFIQAIQEITPIDAKDYGKIVGAIVANCNPFTLGHRYLIEEALKQCDYLHVFVLSDKRTFYSAKDRYQMVLKGTEDLNRVMVHQASDYMVSAATFPTYYLKEKAFANKANCEFDLEMFAEIIASPLKITRRFVGTEPICRVTGSYNTAMKQILPEYGIEVIEIERKIQGEEVISASRVREAVKKGRFQDAESLVPETTWKYLTQKS